jgi:UDP-N-acetylglucosamine--N-acetylmuramyl-(pentapeptide) pyrophosphoryl-undecaprenol N-acetylglucosamine transferase
VRVLISGGGTGGHIYPALAIAQGLLKRQPDVTLLYVGIRNGMEADIVPATGLEFAGISGRGLPRRLSAETLKTAAISLKALWETKSILKRFHPDLVIGTGGYVSGPVVLTAALFGIPTLLHEQNAYPGVTNRILARIVKGVLLTFPESQARMPGNAAKIQVVGFPVRSEIGGVHRQEAAAFFGLRSDKRTVLVTGGSQGARSLNQAMLTVAERLRDNQDIQLIWATGKATYEETVEGLKKKNLRIDRPQWRIGEYIENMPQALGCADLVVGRAGAASLAEIMIAGKAAILIPYPHAAANHQEYNAQALTDAGAARLILDKELSGDGLWREMNRLLNDGEALQRMGQASRSLGQPEALNKILDRCWQTAWR